MKDFLKEYFYIPKHGKVGDKVMLFRTGLTIVIMLICLMVMSISAFAYFSCNVTSAINPLKGASFDASVSVQIKDETGETVPVTKLGQRCTAELKANNRYYITARHSNTSTAKTGFIIITAEHCNDRYHTRQIGKIADGTSETIYFYLAVEYDTSVTFQSHWGTSSYYGYPDENSEFYILNGEELTLSITPPQSSDDPENAIDITDAEGADETSSDASDTDSSASDTTDGGNPTDDSPSSDSNVQTSEENSDSEVIQSSVTDTDTQEPTDTPSEQTTESSQTSQTTTDSAASDQTSPESLS